MATRRNTPTPPPPAPPPADAGVIEWPLQQSEGDEQEDDQTSADRIISMLANSTDADRAYIKVSRVVAGKVEFCTKYSAAAFEEGDLDMLREQWGPGEYQLVVYGTPPGSSRFVILARKTVQVAAPRVTAGGAVPAPASSELSALVQQLADSQREMLRALTERPPVDPMAQMRDTLAMMTMFREAMGGTVTAPAASAKSTIAEMIEALRELRAVSEEINPAAPSAGPMGMLEKMLPLLQSAIQAQQQRPALPAPGAVPALHYPPIAPAVAAAPAPVPVVPGGTTPTDANPEATDVNAITIIQLRGYLATLVKMASDQAPIEPAATLVYEKLPDEIISVMEGEKWFDEFVQVAPEAKPFEPWFQQVRTAALAMFDEPEDAA